MSKNMLASLQWARALVRVLTLLRQHSGGRDLTNFIGALFFASPSDVFDSACDATEPWGRLFPSFFVGLRGFMDESMPQYQGAALQVYPAIGSLEKTCLGPHCTCAFLADRDQRLRADNPNMVKEQTLRPRAERPIRSRMPAHQANAPDGFAPRKDTMSYTVAPLRFHYVAEMRLPAGMPGALRFRPDTRRGSRCQLPPIFHQVLLDIDECIVAARSFITTLAAEEARMYTGIGANAGMKLLHEKLALCFDWQRLAYAPPTSDDIHAFGTVATLLMPYLLSTIWPSKAEFPRVRHAWPRVFHLQRQYVGLARLVRTVVQRFGPYARQAGWLQHTGYLVEPIEAYTEVCKIVRTLSLPSQG